MRRSSYGTGTLFKRGNIWYVAYWLNGKQVQRSSGSTDLQAAKRLRDQILGMKARGEFSALINDQVKCSELLDDLLEHVKANGKASTHKVWTWCIEATIRPHFGRMMAGKLTSQTLREYRRKRIQDGKSDATCNRELSILRTAMHLGRKQTPPKVTSVPYFPIVREVNARQGFLTDEQYTKLRDALSDGLKPLFVTAYFTGVRIGELLAWRWEQVDLEQGFVTLRANETKNGFSRAVPVLDGDMRDWLEWALKQSNGCPKVFNRSGHPIKEFRRAWKDACAAAGVPDLKFHDLRRTAVRNMRRAGVPQIVRMRITGHRTDSMERRYNIVDIDDIRTAKAQMEKSSLGSKE